MTLELPKLDNLPDKSPREKLTLLLKFVKNWSTFEGEGPEIALDFFMTWVGQLYLDYFQYHLDEAEACGREHLETLLSIKDPNLCETMYACRETSSVVEDDEIPDNMPESHW